MKFPAYIGGSAFDVARRLSTSQASVLLAAWNDAISASARVGRPTYTHYYRRPFGFGIKPATAKSLARLGCVREWVEVKFYDMRTQCIELTDYGFQVAAARAEIDGIRPIYRLPPEFFAAAAKPSGDES